MTDARIAFDHIHIISEDPEASAKWYADILGSEIAGTHETMDAIQIRIEFSGATLMVRGRRPGEEPGQTNSMRHFDDYISHDEWGTDHFGFSVIGGIDAFCDEIREKGAVFSVEPYEFLPGARIAYLEGPDGVSIELVQAKT